MCKKCDELYKAIKNTTIISGPGMYPSTLELAYMVSLEYYIDMKHDCIHEIPEVNGAKIKITEMVKFLEAKKWRKTGSTSNEGFKTCSFINAPAKQLVIVHRGTDNWEQFKTDLNLAFDIIKPNVIKMADWHTSQSLLNHALSEENNKFVRNDFSVTITGHSLGGWLAQMCTLLSKYPKFHPVGPRGNIYFPNGKFLDMDQAYDLHCVTFDSPGAGTVLRRLDKVTQDAALLMGREKEVKQALASLDISVYLSNPNLVNKCGTHFGKVERIDVMSDSTFLERWTPLASHKMERILSYFKRQECIRNIIDMYKKYY